MPEGPEVRRCADSLNHMLVGRQVAGIELVSGKLQRKGMPGVETFKPGFVTSTKAHGKLIRITFDHGGELISTLGMSGWWYPPQAATVPTTTKAYVQGKLVPVNEIIAQALKHTRVRLNYENGDCAAAFIDMRNFGNMEYWPQGYPDAELKKRIGLDLLNELPHIDGAQVQSQLLDMKVTAKQRLKNMRMGELALEQSFIAGLGNIYRAEALWLSGIDPDIKFGDLPHYDWLLFIEISGAVLRIAYETEGVMCYYPEFIEACTKKQWPLASRKPIRGHMAYGKAVDIFGRAIQRDQSFGRTLWRLP